MIRFDECRFGTHFQCDLQSGDNEDITEREMQSECRLYWNKCPFSMFFNGTEEERHRYIQKIKDAQERDEISKGLA